MRLISFDVGIKNMAYCIFNIEVDQPVGNDVVQPVGNDVVQPRFSVLDWNVMNLMNESTTITYTCSCFSKPTSKKNATNPTPCKTRPKYTKNGKYYCEKHAKTSEFLPYSKACSPPALKKLKIDALIQTYKECFPLHALAPSQMTKTALLKRFEDHTLIPIPKPKEKTASETDLITIGKNMTVLLDTIPNLNEITHVIIENQISPLANRMKTIQGMLAQYFIIKGSPTITIEFVSSLNKLKDFTKAGDKTDYKQHKKDSVEICSRFLDNNDNLATWKQSTQHLGDTDTSEARRSGDVFSGNGAAVVRKFSITKRDDLADCFLQGTWYLKKQKRIMYNENLQITTI